MGGMDEREAALLDSPEFEAWDDQGEEAAAVASEAGMEDEGVVVVEAVPGEAEGRGEERSGRKGGGGSEASSSASASTESASVLGPGSSLQLRDLRQCRRLVRHTVSTCRVQDLVSESRLMRMDSLAHLAKTLIALIHSNLPAGERGEAAGQGGTEEASAAGGVSVAALLPPPSGSAAEDAVLAALSDEYIARMRREVQLPGLSPASVAFAEVMLTEVALRNRDR